ncbi:MAG: hypothetical protein GY759_03190 [Chloroflexi bacterium]|nr:hypothetical protein [Chloroflexota bacterium]
MLALGSIWMYGGITNSSFGTFFVLTLYVGGVSVILSSFAPIETTLWERLRPDAARILTANALVAMVPLIYHLGLHRHWWGLTAMIIAGTTGFGLASVRPQFANPSAHNTTPGGKDEEITRETHPGGGSRDRHSHRLANRRPAAPCREGPPGQRRP